MAANWMRRALVVATCASAALLSACGSSTIESALSPTRFITFGDAFTDMGQVSGKRYTVNGTTLVDNWANQVAASYGKTITTAATSGGTGYAQGNARVTAATDAAGGSAPSITSQISTFLNASGTFGANDVVVVNGGISDLIAGMAAVRAGTMTTAAYNTAATTAGTELGQQIRRLVTAGAKYVLVSNAYDLSKTPWATTIGQVTALHDATRAFNDALKVAIVDLGTNVLLVDAEYYFNLMVGSAASYSFSNATTAICTSVDSGPGIGTGTNEVNSANCTTSTLVSGATVDTYLFADNVYVTPSAHRQYGTYAYDRLRARW